MNTYLNPLVGRRGVLRRLIVGTVAATASTQPFALARADTRSDSKIRRARYQAASPDVQTFYRVNRYPAK
jgi:hypothetical protein